MLLLLLELRRYPEEEYMGKKIYVGNLSFNMDDQTLNGLFSAFGSVESAKIIMDRDSGRSKGFAFVEMAEESAANTAIEKLNGTDQLGRAMNVSEAKPMAPRDSRGGGSSGGGRSGGGNFGRSSRY
jgi:RNA recognition motif-containing protein